MPKIIAYASSPADVVKLVTFGKERGYIPDQLAEGQIESVIKLLEKGDTFLVLSITVFDIDKWGGAITIGHLVDSGVTVISIAENLVLKDDSNSRVLYAMHCLSNLLTAEPKQ